MGSEILKMFTKKKKKRRIRALPHILRRKVVTWGWVGGNIQILN